MKSSFGLALCVGAVRSLSAAAQEVTQYVGISHSHADHTGPLAALKNATLLIGKGDWDGITANLPMGSANVKDFDEWIAEKRKVEPQSADKDV
jgi:N-acyl homoserine lactone hydrolase